MREMFVGSGLFSWKPVGFSASRGDVYLDEENHTAMYLDGCKIGHFTGSETGGIDAASVKRTPQWGVRSEQARASSPRSLVMFYEDDFRFERVWSQPHRYETTGELGAVLCVFDTPSEAYEVEFVGENGMPKAQLTLKPSEVELVEGA